jgi:hypothetical protein
MEKQMIEVTLIRTTLHLSCEKYTNKGATYEMFKEVIESTPDPYARLGKLTCEPSGINGNPKISFYGPCPTADHLDLLLEKIADGIIRRLEKTQCSQ